MFFRVLSLSIVWSALANAAQTHPEFNQAVLILSTVSNGNVGFCSGVAIDNYTVLTAAHCIENNTQHHIQIPGRLFPRWVYATEASKSADYHPEVSKSDSDIGILRFKQKLPYAPLQICRQSHVQDRLYRVGFGGRAGKNQFNLFEIRGTELQTQKGVLQIAVDESSVSGDSGGPVFAIETNPQTKAEEACLYAIHSSIGIENLPKVSYNPIIRHTLLPFLFN